MRLLLEAKGDIGVRDGGGLSLLHAGARASGDLVRLLIAAKVDLDATDGERRTALHYAAQGSGIYTTPSNDARSGAHDNP